MKRLGPITGVMLVFILMAITLVVIYDKGKDQQPLRYADIPQETIDWINNIGSGFGDLISSFNPKPHPAPWNNKGDFGQDPESGLQTLEDDLFIFYFPDKLKKTAILCQRLAHEAIPRLEDVIGKYYYPADMNGRKVPIYLMPDQKSFEDLLKRVFGRNGSYENTAGITVQEISPSGYYLECIALNGRYAYRDEAYTKNVLWHEMTHYCYFASVDYSQSGKLPMWNYEGIAEYTSLPGECPRFDKRSVDMMRHDCRLTDAYFPYVFEVYQGGHSIFCHMADRYTTDGVKSFLRTMYTEGVSQALQHNFSVTVSQFEADWKASLDNYQ